MVGVSGVSDQRASTRRPRRLALASRSQRRMELLREAGIEHRVVTSGVDDGELCKGCGCALAWVMALAYLKARAAFDECGGAARGLVGAGDDLGSADVIVGADTVCVLDGDILGKPSTAEEAAGMIRAFAGRSHEVVTGVCLLDTEAGERDIFAVRATVTLGELDDEDIAAYAGTDDWRGKAGGYNFTDRAAAGWPLRCEGDETAVVGLPMQELRRRLGAVIHAG